MRDSTPIRRILQAAATTALPLALAVVLAAPAFAMITGGEGNDPLRDPGWPNGAAPIFNHPGRIAYWEGPPFGGGQSHAECRGNAQAFNAVLAAFARLDVKNKRLVVHDGVGHSFWINPNQERAKRAKAEIDWSFMVWQPSSWQRLRKLPADLNPLAGEGAAQGPPSQIDVYVGGRIHWADVVVPKGLTLSDERLAAHGFALADGNVLEGKVVELASQRPLAARVRLEEVGLPAKGEYRYKLVAQTVADAQGHWALKSTPAGLHRIVVEADGFVPRVAGYDHSDGQPGWRSIDCMLTVGASITGRVADDAGQPLADVEVRLHGMVAGNRGRYDSPGNFSTKTNAQGRFRLDHVPIGTATVWITKPGYCRPGLGPSIKVPGPEVALTMRGSASLRVTVDFHGKSRPDAYLVEIEPEGGNRVGAWGGSGNIDATSQISFRDMPPGRYILKGRPNPSSAKDVTEPLTVELNGGETKEITLRAK